jgi:hypothetical protein
MVGRYPLEIAIGVQFLGGQPKFMSQCQKLAEEIWPKMKACLDAGNEVGAVATLEWELHMRGFEGKVGTRGGSERPTTFASLAGGDRQGV